MSDINEVHPLATLAITVQELGYSSSLTTKKDATTLDVERDGLTWTITATGSLYRAEHRVGSHTFTLHCDSVQAILNLLNAE